MKIAVMTDVHGNLPALNAAFEVIRMNNCEQIYHTGDSIGIGPFPHECLELLLENKVRMIMGNHEEYYVQGIPTPKPCHMSDGEFEHQRWISSMLGESFKGLVSSFPYVITESFHKHKVVFTHYALKPGKCEFEAIDRAPNKERLDQAFQELNADLVFYGHNHFPSDIAGRARYINPGSLGCSSDVAISRFVIADFHADYYELEYFNIPYNDDLLFKELEERQVPERSFIKEVFFKRTL